MHNGSALTAEEKSSIDIREKNGIKYAMLSYTTTTNGITPYDENCVSVYSADGVKADIESVRGVRCEYAVSTLLKQGFIREVGRKDCIGRPMMFGTTDAFLVRFGLHSLEELPPLPASEDENNETEYRIGENV